MVAGAELDPADSGTQVYYLNNDKNTFKIMKTANALPGEFAIFYFCGSAGVAFTIPRYQNFACRQYQLRMSCQISQLVPSPVILFDGSVLRGDHTPKDWLQVNCAEAIDKYEITSANPLITAPQNGDIITIDPSLSFGNYSFSVTASKSNNLIVEPFTSNLSLIVCKGAVKVVSVAPRVDIIHNGLDKFDVLNDSDIFTSMFSRPASELCPVTVSITAPSINPGYDLIQNGYFKIFEENSTLSRLEWQPQMPIEKPIKPGSNIAPAFFTDFQL